MKNSFISYFCAVKHLFSHLYEIYSKHPQVAILAQALQPESKVRLKGLLCSSQALVAAAAMQQRQGNHIFVLPDSDAAAYFHNDLANILGDDRVFYFPSSYKRMTAQMQPHEGNIILRTRTLEALLNPSHKGMVVVTYPHALAEKVVSGDNLQRNTLQLLKGEKISIDFIREMLHEYNFTMCDFVY